MKDLHPLTFALVIIGALNWGLMGLLNYDLIQTIFNFNASLVKLVYILVGLSALVELYLNPEFYKKKK